MVLQVDQWITSLNNKGNKRVKPPSWSHNCFSNLLPYKLIATSNQGKPDLVWYYLVEEIKSYFADKTEWRNRALEYNINPNAFSWKTLSDASVHPGQFIFSSTMPCLLLIWLLCTYAGFGNGKSKFYIVIQTHHLPACFRKTLLMDEKVGIMAPKQETLL